MALYTTDFPKPITRHTIEELINRNFDNYSRMKWTNDVIVIVECKCFKTIKELDEYLVMMGKIDDFYCYRQYANTYYSLPGIKHRLNKLLDSKVIYKINDCDIENYIIEGANIQLHCQFELSVSIKKHWFSDKLDIKINELGVFNNMGLTISYTLDDDSFLPYAIFKREHDSTLFKYFKCDDIFNLSENCAKDILKNRIANKIDVLNNKRNLLQSDMDKTTEEIEKLTYKLNHGIEQEFMG